MPSGKVKWFNAQKGFGFIQNDEGGADLFVHAKQVPGLNFNEGLIEGEEVEFEVERTPKGLQAVNVQRVNS